MLIAGSIGVGLVNGWLAARHFHRARWTVIVRMLLGIFAQALVVLYLTSLFIVLWFAGALLLGMLIARVWLYALQSHYDTTG